jgi:hypothetical protein
MHQTLSKAKNMEIVCYFDPEQDNDSLTRFKENLIDIIARYAYEKYRQLPVSGNRCKD